MLHKISEFIYCIKRQIKLNSSRGFAPILILIAVALIAIPVTTVVVQQNQDNRQSAAGGPIKDGNVCSGAPGDDDKACESGHCVRNYCRSGEPGAECEGGGDCRLGVCIDDHCRDKQNGAVCGKDGDCNSGTCLEDKDGRGGRFCSDGQNKQWCDENSECKNGNTCVYGTCENKETNAICEDDGDCKNGRCVDHVCREGNPTDLCEKPSDCKDSNCGPDDRCVGSAAPPAVNCGSFTTKGSDGNGGCEDNTAHGSQCVWYGDTDGSATCVQNDGNYNGASCNGGACKTSEPYCVANKCSTTAPPQLTDTCTRTNAPGDTSPYWACLLGCSGQYEPIGSVDPASDYQCLASNEKYGGTYSCCKKKAASPQAKCDPSLFAAMAKDPAYKEYIEAGKSFLCASPMKLPDGISATEIKKATGCDITDSTLLAAIAAYCTSPSVSPAAGSPVPPGPGTSAPASTEPSKKCNDTSLKQTCGNTSDYPTATCAGNNWAYTGDGDPWCKWKYNNSGTQTTCYSCIPAGGSPGTTPGVSTTPSPSVTPPSNPGYCADDQRKNPTPVGTIPSGCYISTATWDGQVPNPYCKSKYPSTQFFYYCTSGTANPSPSVGAGTTAPTGSSTGPATGPCAKEKGGVKEYWGPLCDKKPYNSADATAGKFCGKQYYDRYICNNKDAAGKNIEDDVQATVTTCSQSPWCIASTTPSTSPATTSTVTPTASYLVQCPNDGKHMCATNSTCDGAAGYSVKTAGNQVCNEHTSGAKPICCSKP